MKVKFKFTFSVVFIIIFNISLSAAQKRIAVIDFSDNNKNSNISSTIRNKLEVSLIYKKKFIILERKTINSILREKKLSFKNCVNSDKCKIRIGKLISADYLITGEINSIDNSIIVRVIRVLQGDIISGESFFFKNNNQIPDLIIHISNFVEKVIDKANNEKIKIGKIDFSISFFANYLIPYSHYKKLLNNGYGGAGIFNIENLFINNFFLGLKTAWFYYLGKNHVNYSYNIPIMVHTGYSINLFDDLYFMPFISFGLVYNYLDMTSGYGTGYSEKNYERIINPGVIIQYRPLSNFGFSVISEYYKIFEKDNDMDFLSFGFGLNFYI